MIFYVNIMFVALIYFNFYIFIRFYCYFCLRNVKMVFGTSFTRFALNHLITKAHIWMEIKLSWNENEDIYG